MRVCDGVVRVCDGVVRVCDQFVFFFGACHTSVRLISTPRINPGDGMKGGSYGKGVDVG